MSVFPDARDLSITQLGNAVTDTGNRAVVSDQYHRLTDFAIEALEKTKDLSARYDIQRAGGFIA